MSQFGHGQSNPTYLIEMQSGALVKRYVMRKKPPGKILQSAHAVEREFQVLHALGTHTLVPVPKVFCLCTDSSVIGTPFYIMEFLEGRIFLDPMLPGVAPNRRRALHHATAKALASLHSTDVDVIGLGDYGRRNNYCKRQVERWAKQYIASTGEGKSERNGFVVMEVKSWSVKGRGIPQSLRALARVLSCTSPQELQELGMEATQNDGRLARVPLKNRAKEVEAHELLLLRFNQIIEDYNVSIKSVSCSGKHAQRMQLAQGLLTGELRILESASTWLRNYCETFKDL